MKSNIEIDGKLGDIEILMERIKVLSNDLDQNYFGMSIKNEDLWKISGCYYEHAGIKINMILSMAADVRKMLETLRESL